MNKHQHITLQRWRAWFIDHKGRRFHRDVWADNESNAIRFAVADDLRAIDEGGFSSAYKHIHVKGVERLDVPKGRLGYEQQT